MTMLAFDEAAHRYTLDGRELIGVTEALTSAGLIDGRWFNDEARIRGTYVHAAIALLHEDDLDVEALDGQSRPYVAAYQRFVADTGFVREAWEQRVYDATVGYAGTLDLLGSFPKEVWHDVIDIKTGSVPEWVGYQTAAYKRALPPEIRNMCRRWCLRLSDDGSYRLHGLTNGYDDRVFLAALTIAKAKKGWV